jgi:hypothetical protein
MKKIILVIIILMIGLTSVSAQTQQQMEALNKVMTDFSEGKISYEEYAQRMNDIRNPPDITPMSPHLIPPAGKAWVIEDGEIQGGGKAIILKADGTLEEYERIHGIWRHNMGNNEYSEYSYTYTAAGSKISVTHTVKASAASTVVDHTYTISGSTLEIQGDWGDSIVGRYTLTDFSGPQRAIGGSVVLPSGMGWATDASGVGGGQRIFNASGFYAVYGHPSPWVSINHEGSYSVNSSAGKITINENVPPVAGRDTEYNYSVTDFGGGNKTLRIWGENRNGYTDVVYRTQAYPRGTKLPQTR